LKNILGKIFAVWAIILFVVTMLIMLIPAWIVGYWKEPKRSHIFHSMIEVWMGTFFILTGVRRIFKGKENFKKGENYVVVCNHNSFMDPPLSSPGIPGANKTIAKSEMAKIPLFGVIYKRGSVLVNRKSEESRKQSYSRMKKVLQMGLHMCIYPEGTRNKTSEPLQRFHDGAFRLAVESRKDVIPAVIFNTKKVLPPEKGFFYWPHKVEMHFLPPVSSNEKTTEALKQEVFGIMKDYYVDQSIRNQ
jgi:1-acyl-sn-glycerol-3-phosphate acyltransferase